MYQYEEDVNRFNELMKVHNDWMRDSINLIASENITSNQVKTAMVSDLSHRYAEGQAYQRLYQGCTYIDQIEDLAKQLSCKVYDCTYANVQPVSGVTANLAAFFGFAKSGDKMMAMNIPFGGHISHANVSAAGIRGLKTLEHPFDPSIMNIDIDAMNKMILEEKPKIILFGGSLFLFPHPVKEAVDAAQEVGATIMYDGAHVLGLIAGKQFQDPLKEGAEILMGSTHKTFPGPQGGIILSQEENKDLIDNAVFPGVVSNHHLHHLAGLGIATAEMLEFGKDYAKQTIKNAKALAGALAEEGFNVLCEDLGYTESHQVAMDVSDVKRATLLAKELEQNNVILNKNLIPGDNVNDSDNPSGIRIGTQEITRRGMKEKEMEEVAKFIWRVAEGESLDIKDEVTEFMSQYRTIHYAFKEEEGYKYIQY
ncbi:serine hydroxymethyltransferase [Methanobrevibacter olleyae]|uniref:Serine hydroxymethyltransferase n=1 Tax=Methanobrevibacter olleyae TaxID=294671 RepID=A0A126R228_METOL|nr:serine hydroxymethyltransferase [Methanobrevibacter olleyae]AMK16108.1 serine hydroxymethyltransferase GlyA [Methanobrevibacter olleyae]